MALIIPVGVLHKLLYPKNNRTHQEKDILCDFNQLS